MGFRTKGVEDCFWTECETNRLSILVEVPKSVLEKRKLREVWLFPAVSLAEHEAVLDRMVLLDAKVRSLEEQMKHDLEAWTEAQKKMVSSAEHEGKLKKAIIESNKHYKVRLESQRKLQLVKLKKAVDEARDRAVLVSKNLGIPLNGICEFERVLSQCLHFPAVSGKAVNQSKAVGK